MKDAITNHDVVRQFMKTLRLHRSAAEATIGSMGCHQSQHRILVTLENAGTPLSQRELAERLEISPAAVTVTLKKMEKIGLITRVSFEHDGRVKYIYVSDSGNNLLREGKLRFDEIDDVMLKGVTESEKAELISVLQKMQENLKSICLCSDSRKDD